MRTTTTMLSILVALGLTACMQRSAPQTTPPPSSTSATTGGTAAGAPKAPPQYEQYGQNVGPHGEQLAPQPYGQAQQGETYGTRGQPQYGQAQQGETYGTQGQQVGQAQQGGTYGMEGEPDGRTGASSTEGQRGASEQGRHAQAEGAYEAEPYGREQPTAASERELRDRIERALTASPSLENDAIAVRVEGSEAYLAGLVGSQEEIRIARDVTHAVPGVTDVDTTDLRVR